MSALKFTITTKAGPEAVSAYLADPRNATEWIKTLDRVDVLSGEPGSAQARYELHVKAGFGGGTRASQYEVTEVSPERVKAISHAPNYVGHEVAEFVPVAGGTEVRYRGEVELHGVSKLASPFMGFFGGLNIDEDELVARLDALV